MSTTAISNWHAAAPGISPASPVVRPAAAPPLGNGGPPAPAATDTVDPENPVPDLDQAVTALNTYVARSRTDLQFRIDADSERLVVSIVDADSGEVLRQMPSEDALRIARYLRGDGPGLLNQRA